MYLRLLSLVPFLGLLSGAVFANRVEPMVLGLPFLLAWVVAWVFVSVAVMACVYRLDPDNRRPDDDATGEEPRP
jgi:cation transporter-like permease